MRADLEIERQREGDLHAAENRISCIGNCVISHRRWISSAFLEMMMRHQQMQRSQSSTLALPPQQQLCLRRGVMAHESSPVQMEGIETKGGVMTNLDLFRNNIGDEGAKAIGGALAVNRVLKNIDLRHNPG